LQDLTPSLNAFNYKVEGRMSIKSTMNALAISTTGLLPGDKPRPVIGIWDVPGWRLLACPGVIV